MTDARPRDPSSAAALTLGALGVVFGDIGTSPLYAFRESFAASQGLALTPANVLAVLSLVFWSVTLVVSLKYVMVVLRFDNRGEGGILALLAFAMRFLRERPVLSWVTAVIAVAGAALFFGDAVITPAISVLSAVEGLKVLSPAFAGWVVPLTLAILIALFSIQRRGTGRVGRIFGPVTLLWFLVIAALGVRSITQTPEVLRAIDPSHALAFAGRAPALAFLALGTVFLAITGAEALYADMGHFGRGPIRLGWFALVFPALMLNYFGQGALVLREPEAIHGVFFRLAPPELLIPLVVLATAATVIASQATISGAFSVTQQASRLGYLPRIPVEVTSDVARGQIYIGRVNWLMLVAVVLLVLAFESSSGLAAAYGIAVSATLLLETALLVVVALFLRGKRRLVLIGILACVGILELLFLASNAAKFLQGGWFPLLCGAMVFTLMTTWNRATQIIRAKEDLRKVPMEGFIRLLGGDVPRVPGTAVFFAADGSSVPTTLLHNMKHNKVVHERIVFMTLVTEDVPRVPERERTEVSVLRKGEAYQVILHYGFREDPDIPRALELLRRHGLMFELEETSFFLGKSIIARAEQRGLFTWRRELFRWMQRNAPSAAEYFRIPPSRIIELGTRVDV